MAVRTQQAKKKRSQISADYTLHNKVELIRGGRNYFDKLIAMINSADTSIHFQTYIYDNDETGQMVAKALKEAALRGVKIKMLLDGYASQKLRGKFIDDLIEHGIAFRWFEPILRSRRFYFGRRLHHKVVVVDNTFSLVGGVNISNKYNDIGGEPAWLDFAIHTEGEASAELAKVCIHNWQRANWNFTGKTVAPEIAACRIPKGSCKVRVRRNDWVSGKKDITRSYYEMITRAKSHITFVSSYFMPSRTFRRFVNRALKRGVQVNLIIAGKSDVILSKAAERWLYNWLFRKKVVIYEYNESILHGKISTSDGHFTTIGSYNLNNLSEYVSIELNLDVDDENFAKDVELMFRDVMDNCCTRVIEEEYRVKSSYLIQFGHWLAFNFVRLSLFLFTFYFRQHKE